jgi:hypothetical protein
MVVESGNIKEMSKKLESSLFPLGTSSLNLQKPCGKKVGRVTTLDALATVIHNIVQVPLYG